MSDPSPSTTKPSDEASPKQALPSAEVVENLILRHALASAGMGLIPLPLVDLAAITGINLKMLKDLAEVYGVPFRPELARSAVASLVATAGGGLLLIAGAYVRLVSLAMVPVLLGALWVHAGNGWMFSNPRGGWEFPAFWTVALIAQALIGPGAFALKVPDLAALLGRRAASAQA